MVSSLLTFTYVIRTNCVYMYFMQVSSRASLISDCASASERATRRCGLFDQTDGHLHARDDDDDDVSDITNSSAFLRDVSVNTSAHEKSEQRTN